MNDEQSLEKILYYWKWTEILILASTSIILTAKTCYDIIVMA